MAEFLNEQFPIEVEYGASFKHTHAVQIQTTQSGDEFRRLLHPFVRLDYQVSFKQLESWVMDEVISFYQRTNGPFRGFRVKDLADYSTNDYKLAPTSSDMRCIPLNDGGGATATQFQIVRWYGDSNDAYCARRYIKKPVAGTVVASTNSPSHADLVLTTDYTVDYTTGIITTTTARPKNSIYAGCEFDVPCRFDGEPSSGFSGYDVLSVSGISLIEIFNP